MKNFQRWLFSFAQKFSTFLKYTVWPAEIAPTVHRKIGLFPIGKVIFCQKVTLLKDKNMKFCQSFYLDFRAVTRSLRCYRSLRRSLAASKATEKGAKRTTVWRQRRSAIAKESCASDCQNLEPSTSAAFAPKGRPVVAGVALLRKATFCFFFFIFFFFTERIGRSRGS